MNREEFFKLLENQLKGIPENEIFEALRYYKEYFDEAGPENERNVMEELGSPEAIAANLKAEIAIKELDNQESPTLKKGISAIWLVLLSVFAAPIAIPLAFGILTLVFALVVAALAVVFSLVVVVIALFVSGILSVVAGLSVLIASWSTGIFAIGTGLSLLGIALLLGIVMVYVARALFSGIAKFINKMIKGKGKRGNLHE